MKNFKSTVLTSFFLAGLPASVALCLYFGGVIEIPTQGAFFTVPFLIGTVTSNYLFTMVYLLLATRTEAKNGGMETVQQY